MKQYNPDPLGTYIAAAQCCGCKACKNLLDAVRLEREECAVIATQSGADEVAKAIRKRSGKRRRKKEGIS